jgi:hypothetical protein
LRRQTNLVIKDDLPQIFEDPGDLFVVLNMGNKLPQSFFNTRELAGGNSAPSLKWG